MAEANGDENTRDDRPTDDKGLEADPTQRYKAAKARYEHLLHDDFPGFDPEEVLNQIHNEEWALRMLHKFLMP